MNFAKKSMKATACLSGFLFGGIGLFAYSPFDYWIVSFISAIALIWIATLPQKAAALLGVLTWAVSYFAIGVNWVHVSMIQFGGVPEIVSYLAVLLLAIYLAFYPLLFAYVIQRFKLINPWSIAAIWTFSEYLRGVIFTGFPWLQFGYSLIDSPFSGIAPILGVEGLTFLVMLISGYMVQCQRLFANKASNFTAWLAMCGVIFMAILSQFIIWVAPDESKESKLISLVQGNIEQRMKWNPEHFDHTIRTYESLIGEVMGKSDVIILPESAIPVSEAQISPLLEQLHWVGMKAGSELIMGTLYQNSHGLFNSAVVLGNSEYPYSLDTSLRFNKHHLVPFGEYVPFGNLLNWMREVFVLPVNLAQGDFIQKPLFAGQRQFNTAICYEIIFGDQVQQNQKAYAADYLLTITNDAWFGESIGPWQHFQMARMRALELGKPLLRAANTGITAFVGANGQIEQQAPQFETLVLSQEVKSYQGQTPFAFWGNWAIYGLSLLVILFEIAYRRKFR
ncbi:Apolipoprotein N-acyltransferase [Bibersteinia trehalosi USDA-ARS-USMARC-188]|uniref:Apolipoprotein N-acyltransferase n=2 Tax=Bibersteinia trehalosi TaxID=47735 RepID=A0A4V7I997_BIBTR|nr:apolipoprotein N-acyltransferase [Bibersteinia trehalosi]AGH38650.1 Apolipoprotein N-acyltransferase [Bibersteinia trehalosi USDA-ARS-USMARC-192]AHG81549.1 Apolipoprotein N-acyltransferase [Bibersteinia trehalosi USDA-ARS-USMARC-188]AHG83824.1 Apolipoprotein N-acyltransferase [Bibersteinia trehalosi USDA-ARS-USMARC-189]